MTTRVLRRPRTTAERRAACAAATAEDRDEEIPGLRPRPRPTAWDDQVIAALSDRSRDVPPHLRRRGDR